MFVFRLFRTTRITRALFAITLILTVTMLLSVQGLTLAAGTITGIVFRDYNANGIQDAREPGVGNVNILAYDSTGAAVGTAISSNAAATLGQYTLNFAGPDTRVRVEFATPAGFQNGAFGTGSGTSVQFVNAGGTANYGVNIADDYCQAPGQLSLTTSCFVFGDQTGSNGNAIISHPYNGGAETVHATAGQVGTVYGLAFERPSAAFAQGRVFAAAYSKRLAGYGPSGPGAIYSVPMDGAGGAAPVPFVTLNAGPDTHSAYTQAEGQLDVGAGANAYPSATSPYALVGKAALGDIDISEDGTTLFVVNLFDRTINAINVATATVISTVAVPNPGCVNGQARPFGLGIRDGVVYVGGVCTAEGAGGTAANLSAYVYSFTIGGGFSGAPVINFPLNYPRGCGDIDNTYLAGGVNTVCRTGVQGSLAEWQPWSDVWPTPEAAGNTGESGGYFTHAQPMLSDIEFDNGDMILGFRDRQADQTGWDDAKPDAGILTGTNLNTISAGDILRASPNGVGGWTIENNAQSNPPGTFANAAGANTEEGPGNGEFYHQDNIVVGIFGHDEILNGGLAQVPGYADVAATVMDPFILVSGGVAKFNNTTGASPNRYEIYQGGNPNFGKANGLGDLEPMCNAAPIEIGNYVWIDTDNDGIQDSNEVPLANVQVQLFNPGTNTVIATATTDAQGRYIFSSNPAGATTGSFIYNLNILPSTAYQVRIDTTQGALTGYTPSPANVGAPANVVRDSNGQTGITANFVVAPVTTGTPGQNDHTIDFGFTPPVTYSLGNRVWRDNDNSGNITVGEPGIDGVVVNLLDSAGNPFLVGGNPVTATTANGGYYRFDDLPAGQYIVEIAAANFNAAQPLNGLVSSTGAFQEANPDLDVDSNDNGLDVPVGGAIRSGTVTLGPPGPAEPTLEGDVPTPNPIGEAPDARSNLTVDFGFNPPLVFSLGNRVWIDTDNSGDINVADGATPGRGGVIVNLLDGAGNPFLVGGNPATATTDANGYYRFDDLPAGQYIVEVAAVNFNAGQQLNGYTSSTGAAQEANPNTDGDNNDNGLDVPVAGAIRSGVVTLGPTANEPINPQDADGPAVPPPGEAPDAQSNRTVDFGFNPPLLFSLGNRVWRDVDNSGNINPADGAAPGIGNVVVNLLDGAGNPFLVGGNPVTTTTDANGYYRFDNLPAGDYIVEIAAANFGAAQPLNALTSSTGAAQEANPNTDGDNNDNGLDAPVAGAIRSGVVSLGPTAVEPTTDADGPAVPPPGEAPNPQSNRTVDFGFFSNFYSLGNRVWLDNGAGGGTANNGVQDGTELGIFNVVVNLLDGAGNPFLVGGNPVTTNTDANGYYRFDGLPAGQYIVEIPAANFTGPLLNLASTADTANASNPDSDVDRDDNGVGTGAGVDIRSGVVNLGPGLSEPTNETDIPTPNPAGEASNPQSNLTVDFGFFNNLYSLGNRVWLDNGAGGGVPNNGIMDGTEPGIPGVTVNLLDSAGNPVLVGGNPVTTTTDATGYYRFDNLPAGDYIVEIPAANFTGPLANLASSADTVNTPNPNSDVDRDDNGIGTGAGAAIRSGVVSLGPGTTEPINETDLGPGGSGPSANNQSNLTVDFGFFSNLYSLGNRVWLDNGAGGGVPDNGVQDGAELGIGNVVVNLLDGAGNPFLVGGNPATTTTDANGYYLFDNLPAGAYIVEIPAANFTGPLLNLSSSTDTANSPNPDSNTDRDDNGIGTGTGVDIRSGVVNLGPGAIEPINETDLGPGGSGAAANNQSNLTVDFGFFNALYSLGNRVWLDNGNGGGVSNNGVMDGGEAGIPGVTLNLLDGAGNPVIVGGNPVTAVTDANGYYRFDDLPPGQYIVEIDAANFTGPLQGLSSSTDTGNTPNPDSDIDRDDNGIGTGTGAAVRSGIINLGPGGSEPTNETDLGPGGSGAAANNRSNLTVDFGFFGETYALGNRVWYDDNSGNPGLATNNDGLLNAGEFGFDGVTVNLYRANAPAVIVATTTTQCGGYYQFNNLTPGDYIVEIPASNFGAGAILNGLTNSTGAGQEADPDTDGDSNDNGIDVPSGTAVRSAAVTLGPGGSEPVNDTDVTPCIAATAANDHTNLSVDFGFFGTPVSYSLGNRVWRDNNNSGAIDAGEPGIGSVVLNLYTVAGGVPSATPLRTTSTNPNGYYLFDNLPAGDYVVAVSGVSCTAGAPLSGLSNSTGASQEANPNNDGDSNDNGLDSTGICAVRSGIVTLGEGTGTQEPINEADLGPQGSGIAANNRSNLTVDFGYYGATAPGGVVGAPGPARVDPVIGKEVTPPFGLPGDLVNWMITVSNPNSVPLNNVGFTDPVPDGLEVVRARVTGGVGTVTVNGQTVTYEIATLNPGQSVQIIILTRVRQGITVPFSITNTATLTNGYVGTSSAVLLSVGKLPATGETPWWQTPTLILIGISVLGIGGWQVRRVRLRA
ncbi:MAG: SdrD B-like domain-containing protein [Anaerolineae bacterium]